MDGKLPSLMIESDAWSDHLQEIKGDVEEELKQEQEEEEEENDDTGTKEPSEDEMEF